MLGPRRVYRDGLSGVDILFSCVSLISMFGLPLAMKVVCSERQKEVVNWVNRNGGSVE